MALQLGSEHRVQRCPSGLWEAVDGSANVHIGLFPKKGFCGILWISRWGQSLTPKWFGARVEIKSGTFLDWSPCPCGGGGFLGSEQPQSQVFSAPSRWGLWMYPPQGGGWWVGGQLLWQQLLNQPAAATCSRPPTTTAFTTTGYRRTASRTWR